MDQSLNGTVSKAGDKINSTAHDVKSLVADGVKRVEKTASNFESLNMNETVQSQLKALKEQSQVVLDRTEELVKKYPFYAVFGAAAVGALVASLITNTMNSRRG